MSKDKLVGVLVSLLVALLLAWLAEYRKQVHEINERLDILADRAARSEQSEFWTKDALDRIEGKVDRIVEGARHD